MRCVFVWYRSFKIGPNFRFYTEYSETNFWSAAFQHVRRYLSTRKLQEKYMEYFGELYRVRDNRLHFKQHGREPVWLRKDIQIKKARSEYILKLDIRGTVSQRTFVRKYRMPASLVHNSNVWFQHTCYTGNHSYLVVGAAHQWVEKRSSSTRRGFAVTDYEQCKTSELLLSFITTLQGTICKRIPKYFRTAYKLDSR